MNKWVYGIGAAALVALLVLLKIAYAPGAGLGARYAQRMAECGAVQGSSLRVADTSRLFINLPKDLYPDKQLLIVSKGATAGSISNAGPYGEAFGAQGRPNCWSYYFEFDLPAGSASGQVELHSPSAVMGVPDYQLTVSVERR